MYFNSFMQRSGLFNDAGSGGRSPGHGLRLLLFLTVWLCLFLFLNGTAGADVDHKWENGTLTITPDDPEGTVNAKIWCSEGLVYVKGYKISSGDSEDPYVYCNQIKSLRIEGSDGDDTVDLTGFGGYLRADLKIEVQLGEGNNTFYGSNHAEYVVAGDGDDTIETNGGNDEVQPWGGSNVVKTGDGDDKIEALKISEGNNLFDGGNGDDTITDDSRMGKSTIIGGAGNDTIKVNALEIDIDAGAGDDKIEAIAATTEGSVEIKVDGGDGNDNIKASASPGYYGEKGTVTVDAGEGDDCVDAFCSNNSKVNISTGDGADEVEVNGNVKSEINVDTGQGDDKVKVGNGYNNEGADNNIKVNTGDGNDKVDASRFNAEKEESRLLIETGNDDDEVKWRKGWRVQVDGGSGNDTYIPGKGFGWEDYPAGADQNSPITDQTGEGDLNEMILTDEEGIDLLDFSEAESGVTIDLDLQNECQVVDGECMVLAGRFENLIGSAFNDHITLDPLEVARTLDGGEGRDVLNVDDKGASATRGKGLIEIDGYEPVGHSNFEKILIGDARNISAVNVFLRLLLH